MKHWRETAGIIGRVLHLASLGRRAALATVVHIAGSSYRRPGAKFLVEDDGRTVGGVSGGCLEADVRETAQQVIASGIPRLLHYDTGSDDNALWGLGLGCNGSVDIFVQSMTEPLALEESRTLLDHFGRADTFAVATIVKGPADVGRWIVVHAKGQRAGATGQSHLDGDLTRLASSGLAQSRSRLDYLVPTAMETPKWETDKTVTPSPRHPFGAKGVGESATVGAPPAIANAVVDALAHLGLRHIDIPITPEKVWNILREKGVAE